jgi:hypothetical protein
MKNVIQVWTQEVCNDKKSFWGFGDMLRGTAYLYTLSEKNRFSFFTDISLHPISNFIKGQKQKHEFEKHIINNKDNIFYLTADDAKEFIEINNQDVHLFFTNGPQNYFPDQLNENCKQYLKDLIAPNDLIQENVKTLTPDEPFDVLNVRLGDSFIVKKQKFDENNNDFSKLEEKLLSRITKNTILISDCYEFEKYFSKKYSVKSLDLQTGHIGKEKDLEKIKNSLIQFFIMSKAKEIKTYSVYDWTSGFPFWCSKIYDIQLTDIKKIHL